MASTLTTTTNPQLLRRAKRRVAMKIGFGIHLTVFVLVNTGLWLIAEAAGRGHWNLWAMSGWGLGLAIHGVVTLLGLHTDGLRERMLADEVQRLQQRA
jgi:hypothetical protein